MYEKPQSRKWEMSSSKTEKFLRSFLLPSDRALLLPPENSVQIIDSARTTASVEDFHRLEKQWNLVGRLDRLIPPGVRERERARERRHFAWKKRRVIDGIEGMLAMLEIGWKTMDGFDRWFSESINEEKMVILELQKKTENEKEVSRNKGVCQWKLVDKRNRLGWFVFGSFPLLSFFCRTETMPNLLTAVLKTFDKV